MKNKLLTLFALSFILIFQSQVPPARAGSAEITPQTPVQLPALRLLEDAALRRAGLDPRILQTWQKRARLAPALPKLQIGYTQKALQQNTAVIQDSISVTSAGVSIGPESNRVDQDFGRNSGLEVQAVWSLDELLFNRNELDVSRESRDLLVMRSQLVQDLHAAYYELKMQLTRFQIEEGLAEDPLERLKAEQLMDKIDSLSGGEFKRLIQQNKETSHEETTRPTRLSERLHPTTNSGI